MSSSLEEIEQRLKGTKKMRSARANAKGEGAVFKRIDIVDRKRDGTPKKDPNDPNKNKTREIEVAVAPSAYPARKPHVDISTYNKAAVPIEVDDGKNNDVDALLKREVENLKGETLAKVLAQGCCATPEMQLLTAKPQGLISPVYPLGDSATAEVCISVKAYAPDQDAPKHFGAYVPHRIEISAREIAHAITTQLHPERRDSSKYTCYLKRARICDVTNTLLVGGGAITVAANIKQPVTVRPGEDVVGMKGQYNADSKRAAELQNDPRYRRLLPGEKYLAEEEAELKKLESRLAGLLIAGATDEKSVDKAQTSIADAMAALNDEKNRIERTAQKRVEDAEKLTFANEETNLLMGLAQIRVREEAQRDDKLKPDAATVAALPDSVLLDGVKLKKGKSIDLFEPDTVKALMAANRGDEVARAERLGARQFQWPLDEFLEFKRFEHQYNRAHAGKGHAAGHKESMYKFITKTVCPGKLQHPDPTVHGVHAFDMKLGTNSVEYAPLDVKAEKATMTDDSIAAIMVILAPDILMAEWNTFNADQKAVHGGSHAAFVSQRIDEKDQTLTLNREMVYHEIQKWASISSLTGMITTLDGISLDLIPHHRAMIRATTADNKSIGSRGVFACELKLELISMGIKHGQAYAENSARLRRSRENCDPAVSVSN
jgi:hypothetical protein